MLIECFQTSASRGANEICALMAFYAALNASMTPTFQNNLSASQLALTSTLTFQPLINLFKKFPCFSFPFLHLGTWIRYRKVVRNVGNKLPYYVKSQYSADFAFVNDIATLEQEAAWVGSWLPALGIFGPIWTAWSWKMGPIRSYETSVIIYQPTLRNIAKHRRPPLEEYRKSTIGLAETR